MRGRPGLAGVAVEVEVVTNAVRPSTDLGGAEVITVSAARVSRLTVMVVD